jgi:transposase
MEHGTPAKSHILKLRKQAIKTRKSYSKEFKLDAVGLVLDQGCTRSEAARSLEIEANQLGRWVREHQADDSGQAFRGNGKLTPEQEEIRSLKAQVKRLQMEKDILKKATVFFATETKSTAWMQEVEQCRSNCREICVHHPA